MTVYTHIFSAFVGLAITTTAATALIQNRSESGLPVKEDVMLESETKLPVEKGEAKEVEPPFEEEPIDNELFSPLLYSALDLSIADGLGGQFIADEDEVARGAFTVANLNDSDYDGKVDKLDDDVEKDPDLIKVTVHSLLKKVNAKTFSIEVSKDVKLWDSEDKGTEIKARQFPISHLPKDFYVEAVNYSKTVRDQFFTATCGGHSATATMTFIWAEFKKHRNLTTQGLWEDCASKKVTKFDGEKHVTTTVRDEKHLLSIVFADLFKGTFGRTGFADPDKPRIGHGIGFQFTVFPKDIGKEKRIKFDVTRQKETHCFQDVGKVDKVSYPEGDSPNDDDGDEEENPNDEDNTPENDHIYSIDKPRLVVGKSTAGQKYQFAVHQSNFKEFVRVRFDDNSFDKVDIGSRCSLKTNWYCRFVVVRTEVDDTGKNDFWSFISSKETAYDKYKPFGCDLGQKKLTETKRP